MYIKPVSNSENGETSSSTRFHYKQQDNIVTADYAGGKIIKGHLIGLVDVNGAIDMRYHQVNNEGILLTGNCRSKPEIMPNGLHEEWQCTSGDAPQGQSIIEEQ